MKQECRITSYNVCYTKLLRRLYAMNNIANLLRLQSSPGALLEVLPEHIVEGFSVDRCFLFEYSEEAGRLELQQAAGVAGFNTKKLSLKFSPHLSYNFV